MGNGYQKNETQEGSTAGTKLTKQDREEAKLNTLNKGRGTIKVKKKEARDAHKDTE